MSNSGGTSHRTRHLSNEMRAKVDEILSDREAESSVVEPQSRRTRHLSNEMKAKIDEILSDREGVMDSPRSDSSVTIPDSPVVEPQSRRTRHLTNEMRAKVDEILSEKEGVMDSPRSDSSVTIPDSPESSDHSPRRVAPQSHRSDHRRVDWSKIERRAETAEPGWQEKIKSDTNPGTIKRD